MKTLALGWPKLRFHPELKLSDRTFARLCRANPDLRLERTAKGDLVIMPPAGTESGGRNMKLSTRIGVWSERTGLGCAFDSSTGFTLPNGAIRSPDVSWVAQARLDALTAEQKAGFAPLCPDFVVELRSPSDGRQALRAKLREYIAQGSRLGWLIDPLRREVEIYRPDQPVELLEDPQTLSGEDVLPGLTLDLKGILFD
jgi:Uma2 family endonuclease